MRTAVDWYVVWWLLLGSVPLMAGHRVNKPQHLFSAFHAAEAGSIPG